jgi:hypothetical protein
MKTMIVGLCVLGAWAATVLPVSAGWDNVFQPTLFERWRQPSASQYYVAPVVVAQYQAPVVVAQSSPCDPCKQCTTQYVQRSYYQPITTMESRTVMEAVTTMQTSYYYEPVTTVRYSSYYNPGTCCYQQVATPCTSLELRAKSCPVQSWVSRCVQVPVQGVQKVDYWQPVTTCTSTTTSYGPPIAATPPCNQAPPVIQTSPPPQMPPQMPPANTELPPSIKGTNEDTRRYYPQWDQYYPKQERPPEIRGSGSSFQPQLGVPTPVQTNSPAPSSPPPVKFDRIAVGPDSHVEGQIVRSDNSPKPSAKVLFINASNGKRQTITANTAGRFQVDLPAGSWHVYLHGSDDALIYHSRIDVNGSQNRQVNLVSRSN